MDGTLKIIVVGVLALLAAWYFMRPKDSARANEARSMVSAGAMLLDVRSPSEYASGHLDGAVNIPVSDLGGRLAKLGKKDRPIVVYCRSGNRSGQAARILGAAGFTKVFDLGAMSNW